jgi:hypothetical protein
MSLSVASDKKNLNIEYKQDLMGEYYKEKMMK